MRVFYFADFFLLCLYLDFYREKREMPCPSIPCGCPWVTVLLSALSRVAHFAGCEAL